MKTRKLLHLFTSITFAVLALIAGTIALAEEAANAGENWLHFGYDDAYTAYNPIESTLNITNVVELERCGDSP